MQSGVGHSFLKLIHGRRFICWHRNMVKRDDFVFTLQELTADEKIRMQCEGRRRYYSDLAATITSNET